MSRILICGGAGFCGANLALYFAERDNEVYCMDNLTRRGSEYNLPLFKQKGIKFVHGDIRNKEDFPNIKPDIVLECSAQPSAIDGYDNPYYDFSNNTSGLVNVLEYVRNKTNAMFFFWSTNKTYSGDKINAIPFIEKETRYEWKDKEFAGISDSFPVDGGQHSIYGATKIASDLICQEYCDAFGIPVVVNRFSCLAGERQWGKCAQGWVAWWAIAAHFGFPVKYIGWNGKQVRDVLFIEDICNLIDMQIKNINEVKGRVFNIGGGFENTISLIEATNLMEKKFCKKMVVSIEKEPRKADHCIYITNTKKIHDFIGWKPNIGIEEGYYRIIRWVKDNESILKGLYC